MTELAWLLAAYGLCFAIQQEKDPIPVARWIRAVPLLVDERGQTWGERLIGCAFCVGFHCGWFTGLLRMASGSIADPMSALWHVPAGIVALPAWCLACAAFCLVADESLQAIERSWPVDEEEDAPQVAGRADEA